MDLTYLRLLIDERIASGKSEADTSFMDAELVAIATKCNDNLFLTASEVWRIKAGLLEDRIASYSLGSESVSYTSLQEAYARAIALSIEYKKKDSDNSGIAKAFSRTPPNVLHTHEHRQNFDFSKDDWDNEDDRD
jgi:hypothetical protein